MKQFMSLVVVASLSAGITGCKSPGTTTSETIDGVTTKTTTDNLGNVTTSTTGSTSETIDGVTTTTTFDGKGNKVIATTYDPKTTSTTVDGITTTTTIDANGNSTTTTSGISSVTENGITTTTILDGNGNTATIVSGSHSETIDGITTTTMIDGQGHTVTTTSGTIIETVDGITTLTVIDGQGKKTVTTSGTQSETVDGITTLTVIDGNGNRVTSTSGVQSETVDGITTTTINENGNQRTVVSGSSSLTNEEYDALGNLISSTTTTTIHDGNGNTKVIKITDGAVVSNNSGIQVLVGVFIDSPVKGLKYQTTTLNGTTDSEGKFNYIQGEQVTFSIGGKNFNTTIPDNGIITPLTLFNANDVNDIRVINLARLLQTLDDDNNLDNGIEIKPNTQTEAAHLTQLDFASNTFEQTPELITFLANINKTLVSASNATTHLTNVIDTLPNNIQGVGSVGTGINTGTSTNTGTGTDTGTNTGSILGIWRGTMTSASLGTESITVIIDATQRVQVSTQSGRQFSGLAVKNNTGIISATMQEYASVAGTASKQGDISFIFETITQAANIQGGFSSATDNGTFQVNYDTVYEKPSSIIATTVADTWQSGTELLSITTNSVFSGNGAKGCAYKGNIGLINPAANIYNLNVTLSTCSDSAINGSNYSGFAWLEDGDTENAHFNYSIANGRYALNGKLNRVAQSTTGTPITSASNVSGFWAGTMNYTNTGQVTSVSGVITENNRFKLLESGSGIQYSGVVISADNGDVSVISKVFNSVTGNALKKNDDVLFAFKQINEKSTISGNFDVSNDGTEEGHFSLNYVNTYERPSVLSKVVGAWGTADEAIKINSSNSFSGKGVKGCVYTGTIGIINPSFNTYNLNATASSCSDSVLDGDYFGISWLSDSDNTDDTLKYAMIKADGTASLSSQLTKIIVGQTPVVSGIWRGAITSVNGKVTSIATGIIAENGTMQLTTSDGDVISGKIGVDTGTDVSATAKFYQADRNANYDMSFAGTITEKSLLQGTYTKSDANDASGTFTFTYSNEYEKPSQQTLVSGNWGEQFENILLNSIGALNGTNTNTDCTLTGSIGMLSPTFNAYNVNITATTCNTATLDGDYSGLATLSDTKGDGVLDSLTYIVNKNDQYLTKIFTKTSSLSSITGIWRGTFTNNEGKSTFYKGLISEDNEVKLLADTESFPFDQGSDIISGAAIVHTKDSIVANLKEIPANNNANEIVAVRLDGVVIERDSMSGTFTKSATATRPAEFGNFSFRYDTVYTIPEVNFFVINDTEWDITKFDNKGTIFYNQYLNLSNSFVLNSDRTTVVTSVPTVTIVAATETPTDLTSIPQSTIETVTTSSIDISGSIANIIDVVAVTTIDTVTGTSYQSVNNTIVKIITVTNTATTVTTTTKHVDSNGCRYLGNYDVVEPKVNMWNLYMVVSGCSQTLKVKDINGLDLLVDSSGGIIDRKNADGSDKKLVEINSVISITNNNGETIKVNTIPLDLNGTYTGLATLEEQHSILLHPHDHYKFMTFGMVDTTGTKTINNRLTLQFFGN